MQDKPLSKFLWPQSSTQPHVPKKEDMLRAVKDILAVFAIMLLAMLILSGCGAPAAGPQTEQTSTTGEAEPTAATTAETAAPTTDAVGLPVPTGAAAPGEAPDLTAARGNLEREAPFTDSDWLSPHGFWPGMSMEEAYLLWPFDGYPLNLPLNDSWALDWRVVYMGNMAYTFRRSSDETPTGYADYYLEEIYYGSTIYGEIEDEPLCVLRNIHLGDSIEEVLRKLPGGGLARQWAVDQIVGENAAPGSMDLRYQTDLGFYTLRIYTENAFLDAHFGASGKLGYVFIHVN